MGSIKREAVFVVGDSEKIFLPRPSGWISGWARSLWFFHLVGKKPHIASPELWDTLCKNQKVYRLVEFKNGDHQIFDENW
tara:strand:- start:486 stop:725 length:240 start_codon:yes stop_codon:yes gene_type:complete